MPLHNAMNATDWISFADREPERGQDVLLRHEKGFYSARKYGLSSEKWTHWQAIVPPVTAFDEWSSDNRPIPGTDLYKFARAAFEAGQRAGREGRA